MVLKDFTETLNIATESQYAEKDVLHIEQTKFIPDYIINFIIYPCSRYNQE